MRDIIIPSNQQQNRNAIISDTSKWPVNILYYQFDKSVSTKRRNVINASLDILQKQLGQCIQFVRRNHSNRVLVKSIDGEGCNSDPGYQRRIQTLNLMKGCIRRGYIQHEFLHALGIYHTQSRWDRDDYVKIFDDNIKPNKTHNFDKYKKSYVSHYNLPYDYLSLMHYEKNDFSNDGPRLNTIEAKDPFWTDKIGQRDGPSQGDLNLVQMHYGCPGTIYINYVF